VLGSARTPRAAHSGGARARAYLQPPAPLGAIPADVLGVLNGLGRGEGVPVCGERFTKTGIVSVELHRYLIEDQDKRNVGDYQIRPGLTDMLAAEQIARAAQFLHLAQRLLEAPSPATPGNTADQDHPC
jgi:hypothetical protein